MTLSDAAVFIAWAFFALPKFVTHAAFENTHRNAVLIHAGHDIVAISLTAMAVTYFKS